MKLLIFSDSHGSVEPMVQAARMEQPHRIIHLGDYTGDGDQLRDQLPMTTVYQVAGNCDRWCYTQQYTEEAHLNLDGVPFYLTHGHKHNVKNGLDKLRYAAGILDVRVALFGHTHHCCCEDDGELLLFNPGSCSDWGGTYGVIEVFRGELRSCEIKPFLR